MQNNRWPILKGELALQLGFVALLIYTLLLPFQPFFPPITSGIVSFWLVYVLSFQKGRLKLITTNSFTVLWILYYLLLLAGLLYTANPQEAGKDIVLKISLILWPLGFATWPELISKYKNQILKVFAWATTASAATLIIIGTARWFAADVAPSQLYLFMNVWEWLPNHYMALYASFSLFILVQQHIEKEQKFVLTLSCSVVLLLFIALTSVRIQFIAIPFAAAFFIFLQKMPAMRKKQLIKFSALGFAGLALLILLMPSSRNRLAEIQDEIRSINGMVDQKQTNHRVFLWKYSAEVIEENFLIGTGTGSADDALNAKLAHCHAIFWNGSRTYTFSEKNYNYHNEFLQHFATHGIFGLLLMLGLFVFPFIKYRRSISGLEGAFLALTFVAFFTESMLERQAGVLFFGFFYSLLFVSKSSMSGK